MHKNFGHTSECSDLYVIAPHSRGTYLVEITILSFVCEVRPKEVHILLLVPRYSTSQYFVHQLLVSCNAVGQSTEEAVAVRPDEPPLKALVSELHLL